MKPQVRPAPVRKSIFVHAPPAHAFDVFTGGIGRWWPNRITSDKLNSCGR